MTDTERSRPLPILLTDPDYRPYVEQSQFAVCDYMTPSVVLSVGAGSVGQFPAWRQSGMMPSYKPVVVYSVFPKESVILDTARDWYEFQALKEQWYQERSVIVSSEHDIASCPAYQKIIGLGPRAVRLILSELKRELEEGEPDHWFWALAAITSENPVPPESAGKIREMATAWIEWGKAKDAQTLGAVFF